MDQQPTQDNVGLKVIPQQGKHPKIHPAGTGYLNQSSQFPSYLHGHGDFQSKDQNSVNPFPTQRDQHLISPYNITLKSLMKVTINN